MRLSKGGEMMKTLGLVLALLCIASGFAVAETATFDVFAGWNQVAAPLVPFDPAPAAVFNGVSIDGAITRLEATVGSNITFDATDPGMFGNILLGDGYQLYVTADKQVTYEGVADGLPSGGVPTDMWISLPGVQEGTPGGWHLIGQPYAHDTPVGTDGANIQFTDGTVTLTWKAAAAAGWVDPYMFFMEGGSNLSCSYQDDADVQYLMANHGYFIFTKKGNIAMIIDGQAKQ